MAHSNNPLSYRVVLVSETSSAPVSPQRDTPPPAQPVDPLVYQVVPLEESFTRPKTQEDAYARPKAPIAPTYELPAAADRYPRRPSSRRLNPVLIHKRYRPWKLESHGGECLGYLLREPRYLFWLAGGLGLASLIVAADLLVWTAASTDGAWFVLLWSGFPLFALCFICGFWDCVLNSAVTGEAGVVRWPGNRLRLILEGAFRCLWCFAIGPIVPIAAGYYLWIDSGDLTSVDLLILTELLFVAACYWLFAFVAVAEKGSVLEASPANVLRLIRRLGWRAPLAAVAIFTWALIHGSWMLGALREVHRLAPAGWLSLWLCAGSAVFWMTSLLRWIGIRSFFSRVAPQAAPADEEAPLPAWHHRMA